MSDGITCEMGSTGTVLRADTQPADTEAPLVGATPFRPKVLFVDDEVRVVDGIRRALLNYPYDISTTTFPELALQMLRREHFDVIVADERMPGICGSELLTIVAREFPTSARILLTGHATGEAAARAVNEAGVVRFLLKPCPPEELQAAIEAALRTTPFEKRARVGSARRAFIVSHRNRVAKTPAFGQPVSGERGHSATTATRHAVHRVQAQASELVLYAQKMLTLDEGKLSGYELSTRLQTLRGPTQTVGNFIGTSGRYVSVASLDSWVVQNVLAVLRQHHPALEQRDVRISLNVAGQSLLDPVFVHLLDREVSRSDLAGRFLIEVRQSSLLKNLRLDPDLVQRFAAMECFRWGCRLCLDGVGEETGRLGALQGLPVGLAKIDTHCIHDILTDRRSQDLVSTVVEWGKRAGIPIAATGIDTMAIAERLRDLGVQYGQGIAFGAPEPLNLPLGTF